MNGNGKAKRQMNKHEETERTSDGEFERICKKNGYNDIAQFCENPKETHARNNMF